MAQKTCFYLEMLSILNNYQHWCAVLAYTRFESGSAFIWIAGLQLWLRIRILGFKLLSSFKMVFLNIFEHVRFEVFCRKKNINFYIFLSCQK